MGEGGFEDRVPVGDGAVHFVLEDVGEEDVILVLEGGLELQELIAEFGHEGIGGEGADREVFEAEVEECK